jgi:hypothetical protein
MCYQAYTFGILSGFYLAEMTIDRLIVVRFPMVAHRLCTTQRACVTIIVTLIVICGLDLYIFFTFKYVVDEETGEGLHFSFQSLLQVYIHVVKERSRSKCKTAAHHARVHAGMGLVYLS